MTRKKLAIREVDLDAIELLQAIKSDERRALGAIIGECIREYWEKYYTEEDEALEAA